MTKSMEDFILEEIGKQRTNLDTKLAHFDEICKRLGLQQERINEIAPIMREILQEESETGSFH